MTAEADWYPDPGHKYEWRYWDGQKWTPHVASDGSPGTEPAGEWPAPREPSPAVPPPPPRRPANNDTVGGTLFSGRAFGRQLHPALVAVILVAALLFFFSVCSGMRNASETQDYYDNLYDTSDS